MGNFVKLGANG